MIFLFGALSVIFPDQRMAPGNQIVDYTEETHGSKLARKAKEAPFMPIGIVGFLLAGAIGAYKYKHRGSMSTSVFLMQLRVAAQGTVVGALTIGLAYKMAKEYLFPMFDNKPGDDTK